MKKLIFTCLFAAFSLFAFSQTVVMVDTTAAGAMRCQSLTLKGVQCTRTATMPDHKCKQHSTNTARCVGTTKAGKPCSRPASEGKTVCWQHDQTRVKPVTAEKK
jgi:hypothetical protein